MLLIADEVRRYQFGGNEHVSPQTNGRSRKLAALATSHVPSLEAAEARLTI